MIVDPIALADELAEALKAKRSNGASEIPKKYRMTIIKAEILLRELFR